MSIIKLKHDPVEKQRCRIIKYFEMPITEQKCIGSLCGRIEGRLIYINFVSDEK